MNQYRILIICFAFSLWSCEAEKSKEITPKLSLVCQVEPSNVEGIPAHSVHLMFNEKKIKLANILACETFQAENFEQHQMPRNTMDAVGGWWAGAGEYFYLYKKSDNSYAVNYGQMYEEKETGKYDYTELIAIKKNDAGQYEAYPKYKLQDLAGVYTLGGHDTSWMLMIQPNDEGISTTYYVIDGMLPPPDFLKKNKLDTEGKQLGKFEVDFSDMVIESDIGTGQLEIIFGRERITFFEVKSHLEDMLRLTKDDAYRFLVE